MMTTSSDKFSADLIALIPRIRRFCFALAGSMADADDLLQATIERALTKRESFEEGTNLDRWLFRVCRNIWIDEMRSRKSRGEAIEYEESMTPVTGAEKEMVSRLTLEEVRNAMKNLNTSHREILTLVGLEGLSYKEAAKVLEIPIGTVMSRLARARATLAEAME